MKEKEIHQLLSLDESITLTTMDKLNCGPQGFPPAHIDKFERQGWIEGVNGHCKVTLKGKKILKGKR